MSELLTDRAVLGLLEVAFFAWAVESVAPGDWCLTAFWGWLALGGALVFGVEWLYPNAG